MSGMTCGESFSEEVPANDSEEELDRATFYEASKQHLIQLGLLERKYPDAEKGDYPPYIPEWGGDSPPFVKLIKAVGYPPRKT